MHVSSGFTLGLAAALLALCLPLSASAQSWGTGVAGRTGESQFSTSVVPGTIDGFMSAPSILDYVDANADLVAESTFEEVSGIATPLLMADSIATNRGIAIAWGLNAYTYTGPTRPLAFTATLDTTIATDGFTRTRVYAISELDGDNLFDGTTEENTPSSAGEGFTPLASVSPSLNENSVPAQAIATDSFTIDNGETFYLWMNLTASSFQGSTDSVVSIFFDDNTGLVSAAPVPEPTLTLGLLAGGAFLASGSRRRGAR